MKYLVITSKHHDGFCLWPSDFTDYDISSTPWKNGKGDVCKELADACKRHGVRFGVYYTVCDWYHPDWLPRYYDPRPATGADPARFDKYMRNQLRELITRYDPTLIWFDGNWFKEWTNERGQSLYAYLRELKPNLLINNRVDQMVHHNVLTSGRAGDYATPEQAINSYAPYPWETCALLTRKQWNWVPDDPLKTYKHTMDHLFRCAGGNGNLLLNIGPRADGAIEPEQLTRLRDIGAWIKLYGESIYGTRGGPWLPVSDQVSTFRDNTVYVHLLAGQGEVVLPEDGFRIRSAKLLTGGELESVREDGGLRIRIPEPFRNPINTVIKLELDRSAADFPVRPFFLLKATASNTFQNNPTYGPDKAVDGDSATRWATDDGTTQCQLEITLPKPTSLHGVRVNEAYGRVSRWEVHARQGGTWSRVAEGTTLGADREIPFTVTTDALRLEILDVTAAPTIFEFTPLKGSG